MRRLRPLAVIAAALVVVAATYTVRDQPAAGTAPSGTADATADEAVAALSLPGPRGELAEIDRLIGAYEQRITRHTTPGDYRILGGLHLERGRLTGDVTAYIRSETALNRALQLYPDDLDAQNLLAAVRHHTHDFMGARELAAGVVARDRGRLDAVALVGDAELALGRLDEAAHAYRRLEEALADSPAVQVRLARLAWLRGDVPVATTSAALALTAARKAGVRGHELAWYRSFAAQLDYDLGDYTAAERGWRKALREAPGYHVPTAGLARALAAQGRYDEAIGLYEEAVATLPEPETVAALGDLYTLTGRQDQARVQYDTVEVIATLSEVNRRVFDRQLAFFYVNHGLHPDRAVTIAEAALRARPDVYGHDVYAWALHAAGRHHDARAASDRALATGAPDAALHYHAGMISAALGQHDRARRELAHALELSPEFDPLQASRARTTLAGLDRLQRVGSR